MKWVCFSIFAEFMTQPCFFLVTTYSPHTQNAQFRHEITNVDIFVVLKENILCEIASQRIRAACSRENSKYIYIYANHKCRAKSTAYVFVCFCGWTYFRCKHFIFSFDRSFEFSSEFILIFFRLISSRWFLCYSLIYIYILCDWFYAFHFIWTDRCVNSSLNAGSTYFTQYVNVLVEWV